MSALLHSQVLQGVGTGPTPDSAASKSLSPKPTNSEKVCARHGVSPPCGESPCSGVMLSLQLLMGKPLASSHISAVQGRALCPPEPLWVSAELAERRAPLGMLTTACTYRAGWAWRKCLTHTASPEISLCLRENPNIYDELLVLSPWMIVINIPRVWEYLFGSSLHTVLSPVKQKV